MRKAIIQGGILTGLFLATWFALSQIDWMSVFKVQKVKDKTEEKLGELFWDIFHKSEKVNTNPFVINSVDSLVNRICSANKIDRDLIKVHIVNKDVVNAFALPNGHLIIYSGLILHTDNQEELCGVICHEIAHMQLNHVMKKLIKETGLSVLVSMTTGNSGTEIIKEAIKLLSSTAYDRNLEREADLKAVDYLIEAKIDPEPLANFLYKLSDKEGEMIKYMIWISTHPDSKERAENIIHYSNERKTTYESVLSVATWEELQGKLKE